MRNLGLARLSVSADGGLSTVVDQFSQTPLQLHRPLYLEGASHPTVYIKTPSSGLLGGDEHKIDVNVASGAQLELRTQAATLVYPGRSLLQINLTLADSAQLIFLPHPIILGAESSLSQKVRIKLGKDATLSFADTWCAGRIGMQELWKFTDYEYQLEIFQESKLTYREHWRIVPAEAPLEHPLLCGDYTHFASFYEFGKSKNLTARKDFTDFKTKSFEIEKRWSLTRNGNDIHRRVYKVDESCLSL
ncbi:MAG: urease accessory protein UreD [Candidatus Obscuribacterales bacterium]|nr:urease accessory protein UreD [Candidatus Obscuribacterales bacterium]